MSVFFLVSRTVNRAAESKGHDTELWALKMNSVHSLVNDLLSDLLILFSLGCDGLGVWILFIYLFVILCVGREHLYPNKSLVHA